MNYTYQAYGVPVISEIRLPVLVSLGSGVSAPPIYVKVGEVPPYLEEADHGRTWASIFNERECITRIHDVADYYITGGDSILVRPLTSNLEQIPFYIYSNCLAIVLMQRDLVLMHMSGIFVNRQEVLLFAAPSGTGKSTIAMSLKQKGYPTFTDDTALLQLENGKCYAWASYPETRMWQDVADVQQVYPEGVRRKIGPGVEKYAFSFTESFSPVKADVKGVVFLEASGEEISIKRMKPVSAWQLLYENVYAVRFIEGMKKNKLLFNHTTSLINTVPTWKAIRPENKKCFEEFSTAIEEQIIHSLQR